MIKKCTFALALLILCFTQFSFAGEWHVIDQGMEFRAPLFADSTIGWSITTEIDTTWGDIDDCLYRTNDGGKSWTQLTSVANRLLYTTICDLCFRQGRLFLAKSDCDPVMGGADMRIIASDDYGTSLSWLLAVAQAAGAIRLTVVDTNFIWCITDSCYKYTPDGWAPRSLLPLTYVSKKILFIDTLLGYIVNMQDGTIYRSMDGGFTWDTLAQLGQTYDLFAERQNVWLLSGTKIMHSSDSGNTWQTNDPDTTLTKYCFSSFDSLNLWVGCDNGIVLHTPDGGQTWVRDSVGTTAKVVSIFALSNEYVWVSTADSTLWGLGVTGVSGQFDPDIQVSTIRTKAYPNPSNGLITIQYNVSGQCQGNIKIYDVTGRLVKTLASGMQTQGKHTVNWNWRNDERTVSSGIYFIKSTMTGNSSVEKIVLVR